MGKERTLNSIRDIIIHCADTPNGRPNTAEDINRWHQARGFQRNLSILPQTDAIALQIEPPLAHIGYHYILETNGTIKQGRPLIETGAHARYHNRTSIGICLIGRDRFTPLQWGALRVLTQHLQQQLPGTRLLGHHSLNPHKTCPGFNVQQWIERGYRPEPQHIHNHNHHTQTRD